MLIVNFNKNMYSQREIEKLMTKKFIGGMFYMLLIGMAIGIIAHSIWYL